MGELTQVIIKSGRGEGGFEYKGHYRAGLFFDRHGRECVVDDRPIVKLKAEREKELDAIRKKIYETGRERGPAAQQEQEAQMAPVLEPLQAHLQSLKIGYIEEADKPLVITQKLYEYLREANGKQLMFEPWDGHARPVPVETAHLTPDERMAKLETGQSELRGMLSQLLAELKKK